MEFFVPAIAAVKQQKHAIIDRHAKPDDVRGMLQSLTALIPIMGLWWVVALGDRITGGLTVVATVVMSLFMLRVFALMHDCGHGSLFRNSAANKALGFAFGVLTGMPQYVWAQHHNHHHATNGNWAKYRGPLSILSVDEFDALPKWRQWVYVRVRNIWLAPFAGFMYLIFTPRMTWIKGTLGLVRHIVRRKLARPDIALSAHAAQFKTRYWRSAAEYWHMTFNNLALLAVWALMSWFLGPGLFFWVYIGSVSLAGAAGIVLFTVQHNFEHSYASGDQGWDYDTAAIYGTSYLVLPKWLNWVTADIGYHHVHHLSSRIPNYCLADCHTENQHLFGAVKRLKLSDIGNSLRFLLWDPRARRLVSIAEHQSAKQPVA
jgi:omega-6 fatty acid desaturase (delta-12 desaturase)